MTYEVLIDGTPHKVELKQKGSTWNCKVDGESVALDVAVTAQDVLSVLDGAKQWEIKREYSVLGDTHLVIGRERFAAEVRDPRSLRSRRAVSEGAAGPAKLLAPMPGKVVRIVAAQGSEVEAGQGVLVVEAMKMQNEIKSPKKGVVQKISVKEGDTVNAGETLAVIE